MADKVLRIADYYRRRPRARRPRPRLPADGSTDPNGEQSVVVEVRPPDVVVLTMTRTLWSALADWLAVQRVRMSIVPPEQPRRARRRKRTAREATRA